MIDLKADTVRIPSRYRLPGGRIDMPRLKADISIAEVAASATDLRPSGCQMKGLCPFHAENTPSFFVDDAKGVFICFGCGCSGDVIDLHAMLHDRPFMQACLDLAGGEIHYKARRPSREQQAALREISAQRAKAEWRRAIFLEGTVVERYLTSRGIGLGIPATVRYSTVPRFWNEKGLEGPRHPAMIVAAQDAAGSVVGIQRTFLDRDGRKASGGAYRLSLGRMRGSTARFGPVRERIMLASAVEDALSLRLMFPGATVWSAFGDANLPHVLVPQDIRHVTICGDDDDPGRTAVAVAHDTLRQRGLTTDELFPRAGKDFNEEWVLLHA